MAFAERLRVPWSHIRNLLATPHLTMAPDGVLQVGQNAPDETKCHAPTRSAKPLGHLSIPCPNPTAEERARDTHQARGLKLARLDEWSRLTAEINQADAARDKTLGGTPVAELLAFGARADVVSAAEHALISGRPDPEAPLLAGIEALERVLADHPCNPVIATIVAHTHMDLGWAWRGTGWDVEVPVRNREAFAAHFDRAADILLEFDPKEHASPFLAAAHCALITGQGGATARVVSHYETWIQLDPKNPRAFRAMGTHLLPRWRGTYASLEMEARRAAGNTADLWGTGAYAWVMFDAIAQDSKACARLDLDFFLDGLKDILNRSPDQYTTNLIAAYCASTMGASPTGDDETDYVRLQIAAAADEVTREHLTELHPMVWAHAARGFDNGLRVRCADRFAASGRADALRYLNQLFRRELAAGNNVVFTMDGPELQSF
ncbi:hypothetical protein GCM10007385_26790 [Tateyamaria omphalii]|uniref:hypothetical protein n=1 Tax=Tateyamaria omphalii TaxID=299262 RepID=UPI0019BD3AAA|nr:hypothetical protein [Tateyamaria omphalii]GGX56661.1 hypothetical protein GCM10007385_26790 [Tateyamaria omphalii]